ncbi:MAG: 30S ribosomal protein S12 methylthiotransferase RimO [Nitrospirae bacterium]|nr:MAG: 30S ribosomal protein S12 methylthiotransferase RimO [Nitrospirota bacterium]
MEAKSFYLLTLGCPKNISDSDDLRNSLIKEGFNQVNEPGLADLILINTCGFIEDAKKESLDEIFRLIELKRHPQELVVFGCLSERYMEELRREIPEIDALYGVDAISDIVKRVSKQKSDTDAPSPIVYTRENTYGYIKIAEGCNRKCSFCAIPSIRGHYRSIAPGLILEKAKGLIAQGVRELILVAQESTLYGTDLNGYDLCDLVDDITSIEGDFRVRIHYFSPYSLKDELIDRIGKNDKICKYIDIPLQHVSPEILQSMKRGGGAEEFFKLIEKIRASIPDVTLRTTFIVGYPGEGEREFEKLLDFVEAARFDHLGGFLYSCEEGTAAWELGDPVPREIKEKRYHELMSLQERIGLEKNLQYVGKTLRVLIDETDGNSPVGRHEGQSPEIDGLTIINTDRSGLRRGDFYNVLITGADEYDLYGELR